MQPAENTAIDRAVRTFAAAMLELAAHELNNRLAVMRETLGLLEDLTRAGKSGAAGTARAHSSLEDQVGRALNIVRTLSGLGGALGASGDNFDVGAATGDLVGLTERWARQQSVRIELEIGRELPRAGGDPALFLCLLHRLLTRYAETLQPGGSMLLRAVRDGGAVRVSLHATGKRPETETLPETDDDEINRELAHRLDGTLTIEGGGTPMIRLAAPRERAPM